MKKIINGKKYDTETAKFVGKWSNGLGGGNFNYIVETLYQKSTGEFFIYGEGGPRTEYHGYAGDLLTDGEKIIPIDIETAKKWCEIKLTCEQYEAIFGEVGE